MTRSSILYSGTIPVLGEYSMWIKRSSGIIVLVLSFCAFLPLSFL